MIKKLPDNFNLDRYGLHVRLVNEDDAEFIVKIRTTSKASQYLHFTDNNIEKQKQWIREYKQREVNGTDYYFMFELYDGTRQGVSRIYNIEKSAFTTGSWVFDKNARKGAAILADIITKEIAYTLYPDSLNFWDNNKANSTVITYVLSYKPTLISETEDTLSFSCTRENFERHRSFYLRMLVNDSFQ